MTKQEKHCLFIHFWTIKRNEIFVSSRCNAPQLKESKQDRLIHRENGIEQRPNRLSHVRGIFLDQQSHLYVVDRLNNRVQKLQIDVN